MPNVFEPEWQQELVADGMVVRATRVGALAGGRQLGATLYELEPGAAVSPLHVHHANEEMLIVLSGEATVRRPESEWTITQGEVIAFPAGPAGGHQIANRSDAPIRVLVVSTMRTPDLVEHPESGKVLAIGSTDDPSAIHAFRLADEVAPWHGELDGAPRPVDQ
jgi:uncharacterized cupin superfamily protein